MKTTHLLNPGYRISKATNFSASSLIKVLILFFYIMFLAVIVKAQTNIASNNKLTGVTASINSPAISNTSLTAPYLKDNDQAKKFKVVDSFNVINNNELKAKAMVNAYFKGIDDADDLYKAKKSGKGAILVSTIVGTPVAGLITTLACSAKTPTYNHLNVPSNKVSDDAYMRGYKSESHYIKKHNTWPCYVLASIVWIGITGLILR